jgi:hypothetical protein
MEIRQQQPFRRLLVLPGSRALWGRDFERSFKAKLLYNGGMTVL